MRAGAALRSIATNYDGRRECRLRNYWWQANRRIRRTLPYTDTEGIRYDLDLADQAVSRQLFIGRAWEPDVRRSIFAAAEWQPGRTFLDIGANIGMTTAAALKVHGASRAHVFEPSPRTADALRRNLELNGLTDQVTVHQIALSDEAGTMKLGLSDENPGDDRLVPDGRRSVDVQVQRLDDLGINYDEVGLAWLDVQGHEAHVLAGAPDLLASSTPVAIEYAPAMLARVDGLDRLHDLVAAHFASVFDARTGRRLPAAEVATLAASYPGESYTDLVLLRS